MSGYEWVCLTSVERRVQYLLKVLMDSKSSKKTLKRDGPKRNVMGFKIIYLKSKMTLGTSWAFKFKQKPNPKLKRNGLSSKSLCFFEVNLMGPPSGCIGPVVSCQFPIAIHTLNFDS